MSGILLSLGTPPDFMASSGRTGVTMSHKAHRTTIEIDVSAHAPVGCEKVSADLYVPDTVTPNPTVWCCVPGGGISRGYFDFDVPLVVGEYSMARYLAQRGQVVLTIDPPGVGRSDAPVDGYDLTPRVIADVNHGVVTEVIGRLASGDIAAGPTISGGLILGLGHSAGGLLIACQQARHRTFGALALLGFSANGLPQVLNEHESTFIDRPEALFDALPAMVRGRFGDPLPQWDTGNWSSEMTASDSPYIKEATAKASSRLLALVGMSALVPGSIKTELDHIDVPTFVGMGEVDMAGQVSALQTQLPSCRDLTLFTLLGSGHLHNIAPSRVELWDRLRSWAASVVAVRTNTIG